MVVVRRHPQFVEWTDVVLGPNSREFSGAQSSAIRQGITDLIAALEASDGPLAMPHGNQLAGTRFDLYQLRWPPRPRGSGPIAILGSPVIRVLYGYARPVRGPARSDVAVILLGGNKSRTVDTWYDTAVPEAERRLEDWCDEYLAFVPRERGS